MTQTKPAPISNDSTDPYALTGLPNVMADLGLEQVRARVAEHREHGFVGVPWAIDALAMAKQMPDGSEEQLFNPVGGELISILSRPSHLKTGHLLKQALGSAQMLRRLRRLRPDLYAGKYSAFCSVEMACESIYMKMMASGTGISTARMRNGLLTDDELAKIEHWASANQSLPLVMLGYYMSRKRSALQMTPETIDQALLSLEQRHGLRPWMIAVDYLQMMPYRTSAESKTVGIGEVVRELKMLAMKWNAPLFLGVQAKREVDKYDPPIPGAGDGQWSSGIEQDSDYVLSQCLTSRVCKIGDLFDGTVVTPGLLAIDILKQREGPTNFRRWVRFSPAMNEFNALEEKLIELNPQLDPPEGTSDEPDNDDYGQTSD